MSGAGSFERKMHLIGLLSGTNIVNGAHFVRSDQVDFLAYCGNRVNLYIYDAINRAGIGATKIGLRIAWRFIGRAQPNTPFINYREADAPGVTFNTFFQFNFEEPKIISLALAPGSDVQLANLEANIFQLPTNNVQNRRVVPLVARADFMVVNFWSDPGTFVGAPGDSILIAAMAGSDVAGSQKL